MQKLTTHFQQTRDLVFSPFSEVSATVSGTLERAFADASIAHCPIRFSGGDRANSSDASIARERDAAFFHLGHQCDFVRDLSIDLGPPDIHADESLGSRWVRFGELDAPGRFLPQTFSRESATFSIDRPLKREHVEANVVCFSLEILREDLRSLLPCLLCECTLCVHAEACGCNVGGGTE